MFRRTEEFDDGREAEIIPSRLDATGTLNIDCKACGREPDPRTNECIRCISAAVSAEGAGDRIILHKIRDMQITGDAAELICDLSSVMSAPVRDPDDRQCSDCPRRPSEIMEELWSGFPNPKFSECASKVWVGPGEDPECVICLQRTSMHIRNAEKGMSAIRERVADITGRYDGVGL